MLHNIEMDTNISTGECAPWHLQTCSGSNSRVGVEEKYEGGTEPVVGKEGCEQDIARH
jgi:hypothetical protein